MKNDINKDKRSNYCKRVGRNPDMKRIVLLSDAFPEQYGQYKIKDEPEPTVFCRFIPKDNGVEPPKIKARIKNVPYNARTCEQAYRMKYKFVCKLKKRHSKHSCGKRFRTTEQLSEHMLNEHNMSLKDYKTIQGNYFKEMTGKYRELKKQMGDMDVKETKEWTDIKERLGEEKQKALKTAIAKNKNGGITNVI